MRNQRGFTLVELMIVAAIIAILAAISLTAYRSFTRKSKRTEVFGNLRAIRVAELSWVALEDQFLTVSPTPSTGIPGASPDDWTTDTYFNDLGFAPRGKVYYQYDVHTASLGSDPSSLSGSDGTASNTLNTDIYIQALGDIDGDSDPTGYETTDENSAISGPLGDQE